jgi:uncharacterized protein (DUF433 family)
MTRTDLGIVSTPGTCSGEPRIKGTRVTVRKVVERFMAGEPFVSIAIDYRLPLSSVEDAVRYQARENRRRR